MMARLAVQPPYVASYSKMRSGFSPEQLDLVRRRTLPFLRHGTHLSIEHLMAEAYMQGLADAVQAQSPNTQVKP